jgi:hypothetical protein
MTSSLASLNKISMCPPRAGGDPFGWIPACAGMTDALSLRFERHAGMAQAIQ